MEIPLIKNGHDSRSRFLPLDNVILHLPVVLKEVYAHDKASAENNASILSNKANPQTGA